MVHENSPPLGRNGIILVIVLAIILAILILRHGKGGRVFRAESSECLGRTLKRR